MGISIASGIARFFSGVKGTASKKTVRSEASSEVQRRAAASLREGYTRHEVQGASIITTDVSEASYFEEETEFAPTIMTVEPANLAGANSPHARRTSRFEDPSEEFLNAGPRVSRTEIDYSVFTVRSDSVKETVPAEVPAEPAEVPSEDVPITITPVIQTPEVSEPVIEAVEAPVEVPAEPVIEAVEVPAAEPEPVVEAVEAPVEVPAEPVVEIVEEKVTEAPEVIDIVDEPVAEEPVDVPASEVSPADEIAASTSVFGGMAGVVGVAKTSEAISKPVYSLKFDDESEVLRAFDGMDVDLDEFYSTQNIVDNLPMVDDGMEKMLAEDLEIEEAEAIIEAMALGKIEEPVKEQPIEVVEVPVEEIADVPAEPEMTFDIVAMQPEEVAVEYTPVVEAVEEPEMTFDIVAMQPEEVPVEYVASEPETESATVLSLPAPAPVICIGPAPAAEVPAEPEMTFDIVAMQPEEVAVEYTPSVEIVEEPESYDIVAIQPEEVAVDYTPSVEVVEEPIAVEEAPVEEPVVEIAPTERRSEPSIISRRSIDPNDVAAILFGC